jgi:FMN reductase
MSTVLAISGSPSSSSRTAALAAGALDRLEGLGITARRLAVRDLPAADLLSGNASHPAIGSALAEIADADGLIVATPIYKASYTGLLKCLLDVLPQSGFAGKAVLPLATGGTLAHLLALDYALRPVLTALGARHVTQGAFLLDTAFVGDPSAPRYALDPEAEPRLDTAVAQFAAALAWRSDPPPAAPRDNALAPAA